jgi:hypothetical protein
MKSTLGLQSGDACRESPRLGLVRRMRQARHTYSGVPCQSLPSHAQSAARNCFDDAFLPEQRHAVSNGPAADRERSTQLLFGGKMRIRRKRECPLAQFLTHALVWALMPRYGHQVRPLQCRITVRTDAPDGSTNN